MFDGDLYDEAIGGPSNGDALPTTVPTTGEVQLGSLFITDNGIYRVIKLLGCEVGLEL